MAQDGKQLFGKITSWLGFACGCLTLIEWCFLLPSVDARISVDGGDFIADVNKFSWRFQLFSFTPDVFIDIWTPFVMGVISILCHFEQFDFSWVCKTYAHFFCWNFILVLFGNLGYAGGIGIIAGSFTLLCSLFSLICIFLLPNATAKLNLGSKGL